MTYRTLFVQGNRGITHVGDQWIVALFGRKKANEPDEAPEAEEVAFTAQPEQATKWFNHARAMAAASMAFPQALWSAPLRCVVVPRCCIVAPT